METAKIRLMREGNISGLDVAPRGRVAMKRRVAIEMTAEHYIGEQPKEGLMKKKIKTTIKKRQDAGGRVHY